MKVLIVKTSSMGDVIHTFPAVEDARRARPDITFDWCVEEAFAPIARLHPSVTTIHPVALRRWRKAIAAPATWREVAALREGLRASRTDLAIDAQGLLKSAVVAKLAGAPIAGYDAASIKEPLASRFYGRRFSVSRTLHAIERNRRLFGLALGYEPDWASVESGIVAPDGHAAVPPDAAFLLHGTSRDDKKWPLADWIGLASLLAARGFTPVTTFSNAAEEAIAARIAASVPATIVLPKSTLDAVAGAVGRSRLVVGTDTGLTHLAAAFGVPTVAIFTATQPGLTGPRGALASTLLATTGEPVTPDQVMAEAERLLARAV